MSLRWPSWGLHWLCEPTSAFVGSTLLREPMSALVGYVGFVSLRRPSLAIVGYVGCRGPVFRVVVVEVGGGGVW